jgi:hypothetical protein
MVLPAAIGLVFWPEKAKTPEISEIVTKNPSNSFDVFTAYFPTSYLEPMVPTLGISKPAQV